MNAAAFVAKWRKAGNQTERAIAHSHFNDLCAVLEVPPPTEADPEGTWFAFEKGIKKIGGGQGFADVWCKGRFAWEYKKKHKDLDAAFDQLRQYVEALENPPLLVACDIERIVVKTRFNDHPTTTHEITLDTFERPKNLDILRAVFLEPIRLKPEETSEQVTTGAARDFAKVVERLQARTADPAEVAHFVHKLIFCMFAEDAGVLPGSIFSKVFENIDRDPRSINEDVKALLDAMAEGGYFWGHEIPHVNGGLFDHHPVPELRAEEYKAIRAATRRDWSQMDVSIFGTLFERVMDRDQRKRLGAHYTGFGDIRALVEPVLMEPLRRAWHDARDRAETLLFSANFAPPPRSRISRGAPNPCRPPG